MARIAAVAATLPEFGYAQEDITAALGPLLTDDPGRRAALARLHASAAIDTRYTALPLARYEHLGTFTQTNEIFVAVATELGTRALTDGLRSAGVDPQEVDFLLFTTVTGVQAPSIDAALVARVGLRQDVKRMPSFGLGCVAGAVGVSRINEYLQGHPNDIAVLVSVELCSLTLQPGDDSTANLVASGLFGDGAGAVVMLGDDVADRSAARRPPNVVGSRSRLYPDTGELIGWHIGTGGFQIMLSAGVPDVVLDNFESDVSSFLDEYGLEVSDIERWIAHPGGPRVLEAFETALRLPSDALAGSWHTLAKVGNLSSAAVLHVLADTLDAEPPAPGSYGVMMALGPGVSAELVLLRWPGEE